MPIGVRLQQLLENLIRNAVDHTDPGVTVNVGYLEEGTGLYIEDDGSKFPERTNEGIFDDGYSISEIWVRVDYRRSDRRCTQMGDHTSLQLTEFATPFPIYDATDEAAKFLDEFRLGVVRSIHKSYRTRADRSIALVTSSSWTKINRSPSVSERASRRLPASSPTPKLCPEGRTPSRCCIV